MNRFIFLNKPSPGVWSKLSGDIIRDVIFQEISWFQEIFLGEATRMSRGVSGSSKNSRN